MDQDDHRAGRLVHDLLDQVERVLGALAEPDERDVGSLPRGHRADVLDLDLARDHLVPEGGDDRRDERQAILALVGDQHAQMLGLAVTHRCLRRESTPTGGTRPHDSSGVPVLGLGRPALTPGGRSLPAPTLGRRGA